MEACCEHISMKISRFKIKIKLNLPGPKKKYVGNSISGIDTNMSLVWRLHIIPISIQAAISEGIYL